MERRAKRKGLGSLIQTEMGKGEQREEKEEIKKREEEKPGEREKEGKRNRKKL